MILSLFEHNTNELKLPDLRLDENKTYKIAIVNYGGILKYDENAPRSRKFVQIIYDGIQSLEGPHPYLVHMTSCWQIQHGFLQPLGKPLYLTLRTTDLSSTSFKFVIEEGASDFLTIFMQIEIVEVNDENKQITPRS